MKHPIYRIIGFKKVKNHILQITFDDGSTQTIDFLPVLAGALYGQLRDEKLFNQVYIDPEVHTLVWPNGADFDPATLHDWPKDSKAMISLAKKWEEAQISVAA